MKIPGSSPSYPGRVVLRIKYPYGIFFFFFFFFVGGGGGGGGVYSWIFAARLQSESA